MNIELDEVVVLEVTDDALERLGIPPKLAWQTSDVPCTRAFTKWCPG